MFFKERFLEKMKQSDKDKRETSWTFSYTNIYFIIEVFHEYINTLYSEESKKKKKKRKTARKKRIG